MAAKETVTFVQVRGLPSSVWDGTKNRPLFSFQQRVFTTDNPKLIATLDEMGYERQKTIEHWAVVAEKILVAAKVPKKKLQEVISILTSAGLKAIPAGDPVMTAVTRNVKGPAMLAPVIEEDATTTPDAGSQEGGMARMDLDVDV